MRTPPAASDAGIVTIDTGYMRPSFDASYLIVDDGRAAFVDTGTVSAVPRLLAALDEHGLDRERVDYVIVTHVHLDHAGGAGALMQALPRARAVAHPRGLRHLVDPAKLIAGSIAVYGETTFRELYGDILPIPADRMLEAADGMRIRLGARELELIDTPGHASHHLCVVDLEARAIFSGDTFGLSYRELDTDRGPFIFPTTTPVQFDPAALHSSIDRLLGYAPRVIYLTHYDGVTDLHRLASDLHADIDAFVRIAERNAGGAQRHSSIQHELFEHLHRRIRGHGVTLSDQRLHELLDMDMDLNAQGLEVWLARRAA